MDFVNDVLFPFEPRTGDSAADALAVRRVKDARMTVTTNFTEPGQPGERWRPVFDKLLSQLRIEGTEDQYRFVVPSFFHLLRHLRQTGRDFSIVFRSFGSDLEQVSDEYNQFCRGEHPLFPEFALNTEDRHYDLHIPRDVGRFFRHGPKSEHTHLVLGTLDEVRDMSAGLQHYTGREDVTIVSGFQHIADTMKRMLTERRSLGLSDYYWHWCSQHESADSGKLLLLDLNSADEHHMFFDDHLYFDEYEATGKLIVDVRDIVTGESIPVHAVRGSHLLQVHIFSAIHNDRYFIELLQSAEERLAARSQ
eukprot:TRINITY_DN2852_c0_g1_i3.p1 TRINITY_DN2852_c0_g1~~TRINITY_DN2852_c0_g1_i3.p1  ORF type:complete len:307 (+),score=72.21 TRINITY_DN2852_c0_g1_i3:499-1419(+)